MVRAGNGGVALLIEVGLPVVLLDQLEQDGIALVPETAVLPVGEGPLHPGKGEHALVGDLELGGGGGGAVPAAELGQLGGHLGGLGGGEGGLLLHLDALLSQGIQKDTGGGQLIVGADPAGSEHRGGHVILGQDDQSGMIDDGVAPLTRAWMPF